MRAYVCACVCVCVFYPVIHNQPSAQHVPLLYTITVQIVITVYVVGVISTFCFQITRCENLQSEILWHKPANIASTLL